MHFNRRNPCRRDGVSQRDARMRVGGSVQNNGVKLAFGLLNPRNQFAFVVGLTKLDGSFQGFGPGANLGFDVGKCGATVNFGFTLAKEVQVWAV